MALSAPRTATSCGFLDLPKYAPSSIVVSAIRTCSSTAQPQAVTSPPLPQDKATPSAVPPRVTIDASLPFRGQVVDLKRAFRGIAQRPSSLAVARTVVDRNIPKGGGDAFAAWISEETAAVALNVLSFFEIDHEAVPRIVMWTRDNLVHFKNPTNTLFAAMGLLFYAAADDSKRRDVAEFLCAHIVPRLAPQLSILRRDDFHSFVKLLQRLEFHEERTWSSICDDIQRREAEIAEKPPVMVRLFSSVARFAPNHPVTSALFRGLLSNVDLMPNYDFASFFSGAERWGQATVLDVVALLTRITVRTWTFNARELAVVLGCASRLCERFFVGKPPAASPPTAGAAPPPLLPEQRLQVFQQACLAFDKAEPVAARCMNPEDEVHYWKMPVDVIAVVLAFEQQGRLRPLLLRRFIRYCRDHVAHMNHFNLAAVLGVLRRTDALTDSLREEFAPACQLHVGNFSIEELGHVALSFAKGAVSEVTPLLKVLTDAILPADDREHEMELARPAVPQRDTARIASHHHARLNVLSLVPTVAPLVVFRNGPNAALVTTRQLFETLRFAAATSHGYAIAKAEAMKRFPVPTTTALAAAALPSGMTCQDLLYACAAAKHLAAEPALQRELQRVATAVLSDAVWTPAHLSLLSYSLKLDKSAWVQKAVQMAKSVAVSAQQFVVAAAVLHAAFAGEASVVGFIQRGTVDLLQSRHMNVIGLHLQLIAKSPALRLTEEANKFLLDMLSNPGAVHAIWDVDAAKGFVDTLLAVPPALLERPKVLALASQVVDAATRSCRDPDALAQLAAYAKSTGLTTNIPPPPQGGAPVAPQEKKATDPAKLPTRGGPENPPLPTTAQSTTAKQSVPPPSSAPSGAARPIATVKVSPPKEVARDAGRLKADAKPATKKSTSTTLKHHSAAKKAASRPVVGKVTPVHTKKAAKKK